MQFLTQLCVKKKKKKKKTRQAANEDATARRYWSIHELIVVLLARAMYSWGSKRGGRPHHLGNISFSLSKMVAVGCSTKTDDDRDDSKLPRNSSKFANFERE